MRLSSLTLEQYRGFTESVTLGFDQKLTLIIGENGAGKSSVLDAIRVLLSQSLVAFRSQVPPKKTFDERDVANGWPYLRAQSVLHTVPTRAAFTCDAQKYLSQFASRHLPNGNPYDQVIDTKDRYLVGEKGIGPPHNFPPNEKPPLFVYYSAHRSLALERGSKKGKEAGGELAAYTDALDDRPLEVGTQAWLWHAEQELEKSDKLPARVNAAIERMLGRFLGEFKNLRTVVIHDVPRLVVDKQGATLDLVQLSDGEIGVLALLLDLTRRLGQVHSKAEFPENEPAVVLIDELDLHLHPRWQRTIARNLLEAFPNVQFIATTHSPQILGEVPAGQVVQIENHEVKHIWQTFGMDSNWLLKHVMHGDVRNADIERALTKIEHHLQEFELEEAETGIANLRTLVGETPDTVRLDTGLRRALELTEPDEETEPVGRRRAIDYDLPISTDDQLAEDEDPEADE